MWAAVPVLKPSDDSWSLESAQKGGNCGGKRMYSGGSDTRIALEKVSREQECIAQGRRRNNRSVVVTISLKR